MEDSVDLRLDGLIQLRLTHWIQNFLEMIWSKFL